MKTLDKLNLIKTYYELENDKFSKLKLINDYNSVLADVSNWDGIDVIEIIDQFKKTIKENAEKHGLTLTIENSNSSLFSHQLITINENIFGKEIKFHCKLNEFDLFTYSSIDVSCIKHKIIENDEILSQLQDEQKAIQYFIHDLHYFKRNDLKKNVSDDLDKLIHEYLKIKTKFMSKRKLNKLESAANRIFTKNSELIEEIRDVLLTSISLHEIEETLRNKINETQKMLSLIINESLKEWNQEPITISQSIRFQ